MSDDWAKKYVVNHKREQEEKRQKEEDERTKRSLAVARGPEKFQRIRERIMVDLQTLKETVAFQHGEMENSTDTTLTVVFRGEPRVKVDITLFDSRIIQCQYEFSPKLGAKSRDVIGKCKTLKIYSDLDAIITVQDEDVGSVFSDDADISELILTPMLEYVTQ